MAPLLSADGYALKCWTSVLSWFKNSQGVGRVVSGNGEKVERGKEEEVILTSSILRSTSLCVPHCLRWVPLM